MKDIKKASVEKDINIYTNIKLKYFSWSNFIRSRPVLWRDFCCQSGTTRLLLLLAFRTHHHQCSLSSLLYWYLFCWKFPTSLTETWSPGRCHSIRKHWFFCFWRYWGALILVERVFQRTLMELKVSCHNPYLGFRNLGTSNKIYGVQSFRMLSPLRTSASFSKSSHYCSELSLHFPSQS